MTNEEYINQIVEIGNTLQIHPNSPKGQTLKKCIELLSAVPEREKGEWITDETSGSALNNRYHCSKCGKELKMSYTAIKAEQENGRYLFCDRCGADMRAEPYKAEKGGE